MSLKVFIKELNGVRVEGELVKTLFYSLITSLIAIGILYAFKLRFIEGFLSKYGLYLFLAVLSYAIILPSIRHVRAYRELTCMAGMMVGMTTGMIAGFLAGFYIGATNGMFIGSVWGMIFGIGIGVWTGRCCGVMGVMEGSMAGFMGGIMGGMTSVMLLNDHLKIMAVIVFVVSAGILFGLHYMIYKEMRESERQVREDQFWTAVLSFALTVTSVWIMVLGPRSALFA